MSTDNARELSASVRDDGPSPVTTERVVSTHLFRAVLATALVALMTVLSQTVDPVQFLDSLGLPAAALHGWYQDLIEPRLPNPHPEF